MKTRVLVLGLAGVLLVSFMVLGAATPSRGDDGFYVIATKGPQGPPGASLNPLQIAALRWYDCSQNGQTLAVGLNPVALACDGANIWVANSGSHNDTKQRAGDGTVLGTYNVGPNPSQVAFEGVNIWVANMANNTLCKH